MANFMDVLNARSSIRGYSDVKLTAEEINEILKMGLKAPTATNRQELHFTAVDCDSDIIREVGGALNPSAPLGFVYGAPIIFLISGEDAFGWSALDAGIAVENMHLGTVDMGLGSVIIGCISGVMNGEKKAYFNEKLGIPEGYSFQIALAVGHPAVEKEQHTFDFDKNVTVL